MRRKLRDVVNFPIEELDFSRMVASGDKLASGNSKKNHKKSSSSIPSSKRSEGNKNSQHLLYDLYGVVHPQGALSGGHYVASLKSERDGKWRLFNDAQIFEMSTQDVVDSSAYILFYRRKDVKDASLADFWETDSREGEGMTEEEVEKLIKQKERCVIS